MANSQVTVLLFGLDQVSRVLRHSLNSDGKDSALLSSATRVASHLTSHWLGAGSDDPLECDSDAR